MQDLDWGGVAGVPPVGGVSIYGPNGWCRNFYGRRELRKAPRILSKKKKAVAFDSEFWLLRSDGRTLRRIEDEPAPDFFLECVIGRVCWARGGMPIQEGASPSALVAQYGLEGLFAESDPFPEVGDIDALIDERPIVGFGWDDNGIEGLVFFSSFKTRDGNYAFECHSDRDSVTYVHPTIKEICFLDRRLFRDPFATKVERLIFGGRAAERAFGPCPSKRGR